MKVENKDAHRAADKHYFFATHVRDGDGTGDDVVMLLLTGKELERAAKRATKTRKICRNILQLFQGRNEEVILLDDTDVAEPKKSGGFLSWFFSPSN